MRWGERHELCYPPMVVTQTPVLHNRLSHGLFVHKKQISTGLRKDEPLNPYG